jgi:undecaprenyl-diphosphatase
MTIFDAVILGIVEGITEFLPVSSTGHLILTSELLGLPATEFLKSFEIAIQLGAMCAVVALYFKSFFDIEIIKRLIVAFIPTGVVGFTVYPFIKGALFDKPLVVVASLIIGGILLILFELTHRESPDAPHDVRHFSYAQSALIGVAQAVAVIPGVSRSGATIIGGLLMGISRTAIVEFSFLLAVPTIAAATGLDLLKSYSFFTAADLPPLAVGFVVSFLVALASIKFLLSFVRTQSFIAFGVYRIGIALAFFFFVL